MHVAPKPREISNDVAPKVATFWYELGMKLIDEDELMNMHHQYSGTGEAKSQFHNVLNAWWTQTRKQCRTWECIVDALESKGMRQNGLAQTIKTKYIT